MSVWRRLVTEAHRRSLWQVLGIYLVGSWVGFQVVLALVQGIGLPSWLPGLAAALFVIGLPIVLATAVVQEGLPARTDEGARETLDPTLFPGAALESAAGGPPAASGGSPAGAGIAARLRQVLTWRRAILAGLAAFTLLALGTGGWLAMRALGIGPMASLLAAQELDSDARILIADFAPRGVDSTLASVVTEAFRIDFARSTLVRSVAPAEVRDVLERMGYAGLPRLDADLAQQVAVRDGIPAYVTGEVTAAGSAWVLTARLIATESAEVLVALREKAAGEDDVIDAIDRLSRTLRERTGESLRTIRHAEPLAQVTTSSLPALRYYTQAKRASSWEGNPERSRELYEDAVRHDSTFASAHAALAVYWFNRGDPDRGLEAAERALRYSDRLGELERARIRSTYHVTRREPAEAIRALETVLALDSVNHAALNNLGLVYSMIGDTARAEEYYRRSVAADTGRFFGYANLGEHLVHTGRLDEAAEVFAKSASLAPEAAWPTVALAQLPYVRGDAAAAEQALLALVRDPRTSNDIRNRAEDIYQRVIEAQGRWEESLPRQRAALTAREGADEAEGWDLLVRALIDLEVHYRPDRVPARLAALQPISERLDDTWLHGLHAYVCARAGDVDCARSRLAQSGQMSPPQQWTRADVRLAHAAIAVAEGDPRQGLRILEGMIGGCQVCLLAFRGDVLLALEQPDSAAVLYEQYLRSTSLDRVWNDYRLAPMHEWLARYYETRDAGAAAQHYARFIELWQKADPELQPRVTEARRRLALLQPDR